MTCLACHWIHTSFERALACYRSASPDSACRVVAPPLSMPSSGSALTATSETVLRRVAAGRAFRPGRPRVAAAERRQKARERDRAYRQRQKLATVAANDALLAAVRP
jgi:hypothetical protein